MEPIKEYIGNIEYDANFYGIIAAVIAVILTIFIFFVLRRKHALRHNVLITGLSECGKTLLYSRLVSNKNVITYTSMKVNVSYLSLPKKKFVNLIDVPGNERLRFKYIDDYLPAARGIIYVIDSSNIQQCVRDVTGCLFMILQRPLIHKSRTPFLVVCNKQDHAVSKSSKVIKSLLEKEMNSLRITQMGRLAETSGSEEKIFLGSQNRDFQFSDLKGLSVDFVECSALEPGDDNGSMTPIWNWLSKIA